MLIRKLFQLALMMLLLETVPLELHGQDDATVFVGVGADYVRALGGWGLGAEVNMRVPVPVSVLGARPSLGIRARMARLESPSVFGSVATLAGIGVQVRSEWSLLNRRLRTHITAPLEIVHAGWRTLHCFVSTQSDDTGCIPSDDTGPAVGVGAGADVRIAEGLDWTVGATVQWSDLELPDSDKVWTMVFGFTFDMGSIP